MLNEQPQVAGLSQSSSYTDMADLSRLRHQSQQDPRATLHEVAKQFEGVFMQMVLKSMREASFGDPIFDSNQSELYRDMFDKQISLEMTRGQGLGLADNLVRQLDQYLPPGGESSPLQRESTTPASLPAVSIAPSVEARQHQSAEVQKSRPDMEFEGPEDFVETLWPLARSAAKELDAAPEALVAQAALETGWGKYMLRDGDGQPTFNLFNIKAGHNWQGNKVMKQTLEYRDGLPVQERAPFRAYSSLEESFNDYVQFLRSNPRYGEALQQSASPEQFIRSLQRAGYATDPEYADKILDIMQRNVLQQPVARQDVERVQATG
ncbi:flagellar assembly peptidoglycan hydrolase FlgJ [Thiohalophilus sp.]|uniref:flagellar assembly peptidoglycan hydrolase FlgJ n=1 Tax=Thiohalophilus sp. TaxID=3028392 RepID=UPI003976FCBA